MVFRRPCRQPKLLCKLTLGYRLVPLDKQELFVFLVRKILESYRLLGSGKCNYQIARLQLKRRMRESKGRQLFHGTYSLASLFSELHLTEDEHYLWVTAMPRCLELLQILDGNMQSNTTRASNNDFFRIDAKIICCAFDIRVFTLFDCEHHQFTSSIFSFGVSL